MKTILIFGGNGLIGKKIIEKLNIIENINYYNIDKNNIDIVIESNRELIKERIKSIKPNLIIILAAIKRQQDDGSEIKQYNDKITDNLAYAVSDIKSKVIYISSCAVYGEKNNQLEFNEMSKTSPTSSYGEHKVRSEKIYKRFIQNKNLLIIRPPLIYDMEEKKGYSPSGFLDSAIKEKSIKLWGNGKELREFIILEDAVNIILKLCFINCHGIFNLTSGVSYSYRKIAEYISKHTNCEIIEKERSGTLVNHIYDNSKLRRLIAKYEFITPFKAIDEAYCKKY